MKMKTIQNRKGEGYISSGVKILIAVVIGALVLGGIYTVQKNVIMKSASDKIQELFDYNAGNIGVINNPTYELRKLSPERVDPNDSMTITIGIPYDEFDYCTVDGEGVSEASGFWICEDEGYISFISLPPFLNRLSTGSHTLRAYAKDGGFGEATFFIE